MKGPVDVSNVHVVPFSHSVDVWCTVLNVHVLTL